MPDAKEVANKIPGIIEREHSTAHERLNSIDAEKQLDIEKADNSGIVSGASSRHSSGRGHSDQAPSERQDVTILSFGHQDPANPNLWSRPKKIYIVLVGMFTVLNSTIGSSIASGISDLTSEQFNITNQEEQVLQTSMYLLGYVLGPLIFSPLSEIYGRKIIMIIAFAMYTAFTLGCALAPTWAGLIIMRLLAGTGASCFISIIGGLYADLYTTPKARGRAITIFMAGTTWGPLIGPIASGFIGVVSWRWAYWLLLIIAGATWPPLLIMPETFAPVILRRKAQQLRKSGKTNVYAAVELERQSLHDLVVVVLTRPIRMFLFEAVVLCSCLYLSLVYAIFYMFLQAFPIIYGGVYAFNPGEQGLAFLPIGLGSLIACFVYLWWDAYLSRARSRTPPPPWTRSEELRRVPLACFGAPLLVISMFWLGWTARPSIHWIVPLLSALPFGIAYLSIFMALINYIVDAYEVFSASAMAAASCSRSLMAVVLPFAAAPMYERLGIAWACSLLGFLSLAMGGIPFLFLRYGEAIRGNSSFSQELARKKREREEEEMGHGGGSEGGRMSEVEWWRMAFTALGWNMIDDAVSADSISFFPPREQT